MNKKNNKFTPIAIAVFIVGESRFPEVDFAVSVEVSTSSAALLGEAYEDATALASVGLQLPEGLSLTPYLTNLLVWRYRN